LILLSITSEHRLDLRELILNSCLGVGTSGRGEDIRKGFRRVNMVEILCPHVWKWKNETC
jgi:hypothetical protein